MQNKTLLVAVASVLALFVLQFASVRANGEEHKPQAKAITIENFSFVPETLTVPLGATVSWTNKDDSPHVVAATDGQFQSKAIDTDESYSYTFTKAGTYSYYCSMHPRMTGKVVVH